MNPATDRVYNQVVSISQTVKERLLKKGMIIPTQAANGAVRLGMYTVIKDATGFYSVTDQSGEPIVQGINLPQTAAVLAHGLALGRFLDRTLIDQDRQYGYAAFEEVLYKQSADRSYKTNPDRKDVMMVKCLIARAKKEQHKRIILKNFNKLINLA